MDIDTNPDDFWIILNDKLYLGPVIDKKETLGKLLREFSKENSLPNIRINDCKFYKFGEPILVHGSEEAITEACLATRDTWIPVAKTDAVEHLVDKEKFLSSRYLCLAIELPPAEGREPTKELQQSHNALFGCLQIVLGDIKSWSDQDVMSNLKGGHFLSNGQTRTEVRAIEQVESSLAEQRPRPRPPPPQGIHLQLPIKRPRSQPQAGSQFRSPIMRPPSAIPEKEEHALFELVSLVDHFDTYFLPPTNTQPAHNSQTIREYAAFYALHLSGEDVQGVSDDDSSVFKAAYLISHFFVPPFFSHQSPNSQTNFKVEMKWTFPIFLATHNDPSAWVKYNPRSDSGVVVERFLCPLMLCEVFSRGGEADRWRMLVQAIAASRLGYYLQNTLTRDKPFFVTAVYLSSRLMASRYIVMQRNEEGRVSIAETTYNLLQADRRVEFLREMYNLKAKIEEMASNLDGAKMGSLQAMKRAARGLPSFSSRRTATKETRRTLHSVAEGPREHGTSALLAKDPEIVERLDAIGYRVDMVLFGYEHVAKISLKSDPLDRRFLKFTDCAREVEILQYLARIDTPDNHTIPDVQVWTRSSGGFAIHTQSGGGHLTALSQPDKYLWSAATQLVEGVAFMHRNGVAHRDIKPSNVLIPPDGGRLSIIDYSVATFIKGPGEKSQSVVGTDGYMAPEVRSGKVYDPICADLWSCGKTLDALCCLCKPSMRTAFIMDVSQEMMNADPNQRPTALEVLNRMAAFESLGKSHLSSLGHLHPHWYHTTIAILQPDDRDERVQSKEMLFGQQGVLHSVGLKVKESTANGRPAILCLARDARKILKEVATDGEEAW